MMYVFVLLEHAETMNKEWLLGERVAALLPGLYYLRFYCIYDVTTHVKGLYFSAEYATPQGRIGLDSS